MLLNSDKHQIGCDFVLFNLSHTDKLRKILQTLSAFSSAAGAWESKAIHPVLENLSFFQRVIKTFNKLTELFPILSRARCTILYFSKPRRWIFPAFLLNLFSFLSLYFARRPPRKIITTMNHNFAIFAARVIMINHIWNWNEMKQ